MKWDEDVAVRKFQKITDPEGNEWKVIKLYHFRNAIHCSSGKRYIMFPSQTLIEWGYSWKRIKAEKRAQLANSA